MLDTIEKVLSIGSSLVTIVLAVAACVAFFRNRSKISLMFRYLQFSYLGERAKRLKETLGKLDALNYENKPDRREIFALMGQINGQLKALEGEYVTLAPIQLDIDCILNKKLRLSEATKRRIQYSIHSAIDASTHNTLNKLPESRS